MSDASSFPGLFNVHLNKGSEMLHPGSEEQQANGEHKAKIRLEICQKTYTTQFSGARILHTENA